MQHSFVLVCALSSFACGGRDFGEPCNTPGSVDECVDGAVCTAGSNGIPTCLLPRALVDIDVRGPDPTAGFTLECNKPGMKAKLEATGVEGVCPVQIVNRTASGVCRGVPASDVRNFRLVYFAELASGEAVELATVIANLDLRAEHRETVLLDFPASRLVKDIDDDSDSRSNLVEFCSGTNPHLRD